MDVGAPSRPVKGFPRWLIALIAGVTIVPLLLCLGWFGYRRFDRGFGPLHRDGSVGWQASTTETGMVVMGHVRVHNRHDGVITIRGARFEDLPRTAQSEQDGWVPSGVLILELFSRHPTSPYPKDLRPDYATQVLHRFRVACAVSSKMKVRLVVDYTIDGQDRTETIGRPISLRDFKSELPPC